MKRRSLLSALSGLLLGCAFPGSGDASWIAFIALVPLLVAISGLTWARAGVLGFVAGAVFWFWTVYWVSPTLVRYGGVPWVVGLAVVSALVAYLAAYTAVFCALLAKGALTAGATTVAATAALWVGLELLRTYLFTGFPWNLLGYSQYESLGLIQIASITGVYGVSFAVAAVNAALASVVALNGGWRPTADRSRWARLPSSRASSRPA